MTHIPWNKGLTKKDSEKIAKQADKKSKWWAEIKKDPIKFEEIKRKTGGVSKGKPGLKMERNPSWKGGRRVDKRDGYILIQNPTHPDCRKDGSILEHRLIMEAIIGRRLLRDEDVNHINGKKDDNRPENLRLVRHYAHFEEMCCPKCEFKFATR